MGILRSFRRRALVWSAVAMAVAALAGCGGGSGGAGGTGGTGGTAKDTPTIRVAYAQGLQANFYHALQNGLFEKHGVKVEGTKFDSGPALVSALVAGSADVGYFGVPAMITANQAGANLQVFSLANVSGDMAGLYVNPKSGISSIEDLKGRTVATTKNTVGHIFLSIALEKAGLSPSDVRIRLLDPDGLVAGYTRGDLDAVYMFASVGSKLLSNGAELIKSTTATELGLEDPGNFIADAAYIDKNADALKKFIAAVDEGTAVTNADEQAYLTALEKGIGLQPEQAKIIYDNVPSPGIKSSDLADPDSPLSLTSPEGYVKMVERMAGGMINIGIIKEAPDAASLINSAVVEGSK